MQFSVMQFDNLPGDAQTNAVAVFLCTEKGDKDFIADRIRYATSIIGNGDIGMSLGISTRKEMYLRMFFFVRGIGGIGHKIRW